MVGQQLAVVHFVNVIAAEDQYIIWVVGPKYVDVLKHRVGGSLVPGFRDTLLSGQQLDKFVKPAIEKAPSMLDVTYQALRLILGRHPDASNSGIDTVGKREIDNAKFAAKRHGGFSTPISKLPQTAAAPARQYECD